MHSLLASVPKFFEKANEAFVVPNKSVAVTVVLVEITEMKIVSRVTIMITV